MQTDQPIKHTRIQYTSQPVLPGPIIDLPVINKPGPMHYHFISAFSIDSRLISINFQMAPKFFQKIPTSLIAKPIKPFQILPGLYRKFQILSKKFQVHTKFKVHIPGSIHNQPIYTRTKYHDQPVIFILGSLQPFTKTVSKSPCQDKSLSQSKTQNTMIKISKNKNKSTIEQNKN